METWGDFSPRLRRWLLRRRNRRLLRGHSRPHATVLSYDPERIDTTELNASYREYISTVSTASAAISLELARFIWHSLRALGARCIVDLGSGFSSYVLRAYQAGRREQGIDCQVFSCDDNDFWLNKTREYLKYKRLSEDNLVGWAEFVAEGVCRNPDFVLHDLGHPEVRIATLPQVLELCGPGTHLIVDDVHKAGIQQATVRELRRAGLSCADLLPFTYDEFGRYAWLITGFRSVHEVLPESRRHQSERMSIKRW